ncbi:hypothetical protein [Xinfangfangia pollutisoli]|uniref:hypothetical protein n=1 Tax=Xinfangfangia pollutisoli TaxID=2865960 RepID=UPI001CD6768B|nr:hypothetical protein [Xinfangfangia pollutisoli]
MAGDFLTRLLTPSPVMHWLVMTLPLTITLSGILGAVEREPGNRRLALAAAGLTVWLFLPLAYGDPQIAAVGEMISVFGWFALIGAWAGHVWRHRPTPVWVHGLVIGHLVAILIGCLVALVRALLGGGPG